MPPVRGAPIVIARGALHPRYMAAVNKMKASRMKSSRGFWLTVQIMLIVFCFNFQVANVHLDGDASSKACPALALMRSVLSWLPEQKACQRLITPIPIQTLRFVLLSLPVV